MAITAVQEFLGKVGQDEALQAELAQALEAENDREAVTQLAKAKGYDFSPEELWTEVQKRQAQAQAQAGELSDEDLEEVAGGATPTIATIAVASAAFGAASAGFTIGQGFGAKVKW